MLFNDLPCSDKIDTSFPRGWSEMVIVFASAFGDVSRIYFTDEYRSIPRHSKQSARLGHKLSDVSGRLHLVAKIAIL